MGAYHSTEEDINFIKVLEAVQKRPGMFMEEPTLENLRVFISGYSSAYLFKDVAGSPFFGSDKAFFNWMAEREGAKTSPAEGWDKILMKNCSSSRDGFDKFFCYLAEFKDFLK